MSNLIKGILWMFTEYPVMLLLRLLAALSGLFIIPLLLPFLVEETPPERPYGASGRKVHEDWTYKRLPRGFNAIWGNDKYGAEGNWFFYEEHRGSLWGAYVWLALRNPANNINREIYIPKGTLRFYGTQEKISDVQGREGFQFVTCDKPSGFIAGLYWIHKLSDHWCIRCRLGYKINPDSEEHYVRPSFLPPMPQKFGR
jgi:hypothetical protein